jgi:hypothetical protein
MKRRLELASVPKVSRPRGGWNEIVPALYQEGGFADRPLGTFKKHLQEKQGCRFRDDAIRRILERAGLLERRRGTTEKTQMRGFIFDIDTTEDFIREAREEGFCGGELVARPDQNGPDTTDWTSPKAREQLENSPELTK